MAKFDFSKLGVCEVPSKEVEIKLNEEVHTVEISPLTGEDRLTLGLVIGTDEQSCVRRIKHSVKAGAGFTEEELQKVFRAPGGWAFVAQLSREIITYTYEFEDELIRTKSDLEKNLKADATTETCAAD